MDEQITVAEKRKGILVEVSQSDFLILRQRKRLLERHGGRMEEKKGKIPYGGETRRKAAKRLLLDICEKIGIADGKKRALAIFSLQTGHSMKRAEEYLYELVDAGLIEVEGNIIKSNSIASKMRLEEIKEAGRIEKTQEGAK